MIPFRMDPEILDAARNLTPVGLAAAGAALLLFGRRLFWLVVAVAGGMTAFVLVTRWFHLDPGWPSLVVSLVAGLGGAVVAVALQRVAVAFVGFLAGLGLTFLVMDHGVAGLGYPEPAWIAAALALVAGVLGAMLAGYLFEVALVVLSAGVGALLIVRALPADFVSDGGALLAWAVLALVGVGLQAGLHKARQND